MFRTFYRFRNEESTESAFLTYLFTLQVIALAEICLYLKE
jgi:hypothetical protein